jgi:hypothetical protein
MLLLFFLFVGIIFIVINVTTQYKNNKIEYRYIEETLEQKEGNAEYVSDIFSDMFSDQSAWILSLNNFDRKKQKEINKYFISQQ